jgi:hypothetical protein
MENISNQVTKNLLSRIEINDVLPTNMPLTSIKNTH